LINKNIYNTYSIWHNHINTKYRHVFGPLIIEVIEIPSIRADPEGEFLSIKWQKRLQNDETKVDLTISEAHYHVGIAERYNQDIVNHIVNIL
jgi:hypothetical protein